MNVQTLARVFGTGIVTLLIASTAAFAGGANGGGGSTTAAQITRYTNSFINAVRQNPTIFKGVNYKALEIPHVEILVTGKPITVCQNSSSTLDAHSWSTATTKYSKFYFPSWVRASRMARLQLAGHERLVLAGIEESNQYNISNKIYSVEIKDLEKQNGPPGDICSFGTFYCREKRNLDKVIAEIVSNTGAGAYSPQSAKILLDMEKNAINGVEETDEAIGADNRASKNQLEKIKLAFDAHFKPLLDDAQSLIDEKASPNKCVSLSAGAPAQITYQCSQPIDENGETLTGSYSLLVSPDHTRAAIQMAGTLFTARRLLSIAKTDGKTSLYVSVYQGNTTTAQIGQILTSKQSKGAKALISIQQGANNYTAWCW